MKALEAKVLLQRIHAGCDDYASWLQLEQDVESFFAGLSADEIELIDQIFVEDGAGELLSMICSGIRRIQSEEPVP